MFGGAEGVDELSQVGGSRQAEGREGQAAEADGQDDLGEGHEALRREGGPGGAYGAETGDEQEVDRDVEHQAAGGEEVELPQASVGGEQGAEDVGEADGDESEDDDAEHRHVWLAASVVEQRHQRLGPEGAKDGGARGEEHHGPEDEAEGVLEWRVESGERRVESGERRVESG